MESSDHHSDHSGSTILPMAHTMHGAGHAMHSSAHKKIGYMSKIQRTHLIAMIGEFVGTTLFLWIAFSAAQVANTITPAGTTDSGQIFYLALAFGFSLMVNAWVFYRISGGLFNPAVCHLNPFIYSLPKIYTCSPHHA